MKVAVVGSRNIEYDNLQSIAFSHLERYIPANCTEIISGGALGADKLAEAYADKYNLKKTVIRPDYNTYGKKAPLVRNEAIVRAAQFVIAFWDCRSRGTAYTISYAIQQGIPVKVIRI